jgi:hypothetical protein
MMPVPFRSLAMASFHRLLPLIALLLVSNAAFAADSSPLVVKRSTRAGHEVRIRGFAEFDAQCQRRDVPRIAVAAEPGRGRVEMRPGDVDIGANWVGVTSCAGVTLPGVNVFYVPAAGFTGTDRFKLDVSYSGGRTVHADIEVVVR